MAKYKEYKDQFVIAHIVDLDTPEAVTTYAAHLSRMLGKGVILLHISDPAFSTPSPDEAQQRLQEIKERMVEQEQLKDVNYAALKGDTKMIVDALPTLLNGVVAVAKVVDGAPKSSLLNAKTLLRTYATCKIAFLTVQEPLPYGKVIKEVALTIDYKKESKEKMLWSTYFARFNHSVIHPLYYHYNDEGLHYKWYANMKFMKKLFDGLSITFVPNEIAGKKSFVDLPALDFANQQGYELLIAVTTNEKDVAEWFIGTQEQRTILNEYHIPILFVNPREDIYVLCD